MAPFGAGRIAYLRYSDRPASSSARAIGLAGTTFVCIAIAGAGLLRWSDARPPRMHTAALSLVEIAPPRTPTAKPPGPAQPKAADAPAPPLQPRDQLPSTPAPRIPAEQRPSPGLPATGTSGATPAALTPAGHSNSAAHETAPESTPIPPAQTARALRPEWEDLLLAALNRTKRYPRAAWRQRQGGIARIRFLVDRRGRVHRVRLISSSGFAMLDAEALALPARAQPLPRPPAALAGNRIELTVPVDFFVR